VRGSLGEQGAAFFDEASELAGGEGEDSAGAGWEFSGDDGVGFVEEILEFAGGQDVPVGEGEPVGAGEVGSGDDAFGLEQLVEALGVGGEHEVGAGEAGAGIVEVDHGEHLAADGFVADPEDEVIAPLAGLDGVGEGEEEGAEAFGVHEGSIVGGPGLRRRGERLLRRQKQVRRLRRPMTMKRRRVSGA
jgi:hypothetical protein